jgi:23S rRNA pseudoU1915 N3-methylase RlmH
MMRALDNELEKMTEQFNQTPDSIKSMDAVLSGINNAKRRIKRKRRIMQSVVAAAVILLLFCSSVKISPAFASYVSRVPGMNAIVKLLNGDHGLEDAIQHHNLQKLNLSQTKNGTTVTINSMIADSHQVIFFYTIKQPGKKIQPKLKSFDIKNKNSHSVMEATEFNYALIGKTKKQSTIKQSTIHDRISMSLNEKKLTDPLYLSLTFKMGTWTFKIPYNVTKYEKMKLSYPLHRTVSLQGQKLTIQSVTIYPTRIAVHITYDPKNTKQITHLDDLQLVDKQGRGWTPADGLTSTWTSENDQTFYLQSNYYAHPRSLYLRLTRARVIDKHDRYITVDLKKKELIGKSAANRITLKPVRTGSSFSDHKSDLTLKFAVRVPSIDHHSGYGIFDSTFTDQSGKSYETRSEGTEMYSKSIHYEMVSIPNRNYKGPIKLKIVDYPERVNGDIRTKIK